MSSVYDPHTKRYYSERFITVAKGMFGYYICLADDEGPIERIEDWNYPTYEECKSEAELVAIMYDVKCL